MRARRGALVAESVGFYVVFFSPIWVKVDIVGILSHWKIPVICVFMGRFLKRILKACNCDLGALELFS